MIRNRLIRATAFMWLFAGSPAVFSEESEDYEPSQQEIKDFTDALTADADAKGVQQGVKASNTDELKMSLAVQVAGGLALDTRDRELVDQAALATLQGMEDLMSAHCASLLSTNILFIDSEELKASMLSGSNDVLNQRAQLYDGLRREMSDEGFMQLDDRLEKQISSATTMETNPLQMFDYGDLVAKWIIKRGCKERALAKEKSGGITAGAITGGQ